VSLSLFFELLHRKSSHLHPPLSMCVASSMDPGRSSVGLVYACITHKLGAAVKRNNLNSYTWGQGESGRLGHGIDQNGRGLNQDVWSPKVVDELRRCGCHVTQVQSHTMEQWSFFAAHDTSHFPHNTFHSLVFSVLWDTSMLQ
jgi:hypothetical protein